MFKLSRLLVLGLLAVGFALAGCGDDDDDSGGEGVGEDFELIGSWEYSGAAGLGDTMVITEDQLKDTAADWSQTYDLMSVSNADDTMLIELVEEDNSGMAIGTRLYCSYVLDGDTLDVYYAEGGSDYPEASGGTEGVDFYRYTKL